jgi:hypothetical protein
MGNRACDELEYGADLEPRRASMKRSPKHLLDATLAAELAELGIEFKDSAGEASHTGLLP